jgi:hypothetical protein
MTRFFVHQSDHNLELCVRVREDRIGVGECDVCVEGSLVITSQMPLRHVVCCAAGRAEVQ